MTIREDREETVRLRKAYGDKAINFWIPMLESTFPKARIESLGVESMFDLMEKQDFDPSVVDQIVAWWRIHVPLGRLGERGHLMNYFPDRFVVVTDADWSFLAEIKACSKPVEAQFPLREYCFQRKIASEGFPAMRCKPRKEEVRIRFPIFYLFYWPKTRDCRAIHIQDLYPEDIVIRKKSDSDWIREAFPNLTTRERIDPDGVDDSFGVVYSATFETWPRLPSLERASYWLDRMEERIDR